MHHLFHRPTHAVGAVLAAVGAAVLTVAGVLLLGYEAGAAEGPTCSGVHINPGDDLDAVVNRDPSDRATTFCVRAGYYTVDQIVQPRTGDRIVGEAGRLIRRGPAIDPEPVVRIVNGSNSMTNVIRPNGAKIVLRWLDVSGAVGKFSDGQPVAGTGSAIGAGQAQDDLLIEYSEVHHNDGAGITNMEGHLLRSDIHHNTEVPAFAGFIGAGVKGSHEYEAGFNFVHDNHADGLWCDNGCENVSSQLKGAWFHGNTVVRNGRWGIRFEEAPDLSDTGLAPTHLAERNLIAGNGYAGARGGGQALDVRNTTWRNNLFGPRWVAGLGRVGHNYGKRAIVFSDSGRSDRPDLYNGDAYSQNLNGETIQGCEKPDAIVDCRNNTP